MCSASSGILTIINSFIHPVFYQAEDSREENKCGFILKESRMNYRDI
jgi:hypothetical protein